MSLLVLAPMHVEVAAVRGAPRVLRTGMGPAHARVAAARAQAIDAAAVAVAGICAGVAPELATGEVVCPTEVRTGDRTIAVPESQALAAILRTGGFRVNLGPMLSTDHLVGAAERESLRETGVIALDMETAWLADGAAGRPFAVVRVVADAAGRHLFDPRILVDAARSLAVLRRTVPALESWAATRAIADEPEADRLAVV